MNPQTFLKWIALALSLVVLCASHALTQESRGTKSIVKTDDQTGNIYSLIIGISDYKNIGDLNYADLDAMAFSNYLKSINIPQERIIELYNQEATKANIVEKGFGAIDLMVSRDIIKAKDIIIVYMAGHGGAYNVEDSYFFPHDALAMTDGGTSVSIYDIKSDIGKWSHKGRNVILVFDACRSATVNNLPSDAVKMVSKLLEEPNGGILFAASSGGKEALEFSELKHGVFTYYLLKGLYGEADIPGAGAGEITINELQVYVYNKVKGKSDQKPKIDPANQEELVLAKVDQVLLASADKTIANSREVSKTFARGSHANATGPEEKFLEALKAKRLIRPANNCAYYYFKELEKASPESPTTLIHRTSLAAALYENSRSVLENDLRGLRSYLKASKSDTVKKSSGYNIDYYSDALTSIDRYLTLKDEKQDVNAEKMKLYFTGMSSCVKYYSEDDSVKYMKHLDQSIHDFEAAVQKFPKEPYLLEGYAIALTEAVDEYGKRPEDISKVKLLLGQVMKLAPKWSYPYTTMADLYFYLDNEKLSEEWNTKAIKLNKNDPYPYLNIGDFYYNKDEYTKALEYYHQAYAIDSLLSQSLEDLGMTYFEKGDVSKGIFYYDKLLRLDPTYVSAMADYANYLDDNDNTDRAIGILKKSLEVDPANDYALYLISVILNSEDRNDEALVSIKKACEVNNDYTNRFFMGEVYRDMEDYGNAKKVFEGLMNEFPDKAGPPNELGRVYRKQENYPKAKEYYRKAYNIKHEVVILRNLSLVFSDMKLVDSVIAINQKIISIEPKVASHHNALGNVFYGEKRYAEALREYEIAVSMDPKLHFAFYNQGLCYENMRDFEKAIQFLKKTTEINPSYRIAYTESAVVHLKMSLPLDAIADYGKAFEIDKSYIRAVYEIGYIYNFYVKDKAKTKEFMQKAIPLYEDLLKKDIKSVSTLAVLADCYHRMEDYKTALTYVDKIDKINAKDPYAHSKRGYIYLRQGNFVDAEKEFKLILDMDPKNANRYYNMACLNAVKGVELDALDWLKKAIDLGYSDLVAIKFDRDMDGLREKSEFKELISKISK